MISQGTAVPNAVPNKVRCIPSARVTKTALMYSHKKSAQHNVSSKGDRGIRFSLSPLFYFFVLALVVLLASCGPKISGTCKSKESCSCDDVVIFGESHNAIKSKVSGGFVSGDISEFPDDPIVCSSLTNTSTIYSDEIINGNLTFHHTLNPVITPILVGKGEIPTSGQRKNKNGDWVHVYGCGDPIVTGICDDCLFPVLGTNWCMNKLCGNCWELWIDQRAKVIVNRLLCSNARVANFGYRLTGLVVSPPDDVRPETLAELNMWIHDVNAFIKSKGFVGGVLIPHFWRATDEAKELAKKAGMKHWDWIHLQGDDWERYTKNGLHFHFIGYIRFMEPPKVGEPFKYETLTDDDGSVPDFRVLQDRIIGLVKYNLNHTGGVNGSEKFDSVRWIGSMAACMFATNVSEAETRKEEVERRKVVCPECGGNVRERWESQLMYYEPVMSGELDGCKYVDACFHTFSGNPPPAGGYVGWVESDCDPPPDDSPEHLISENVECLGGEI